MPLTENEAAHALTQLLAAARNAKRDLERVAPDPYAAWERARNILKEAAPREFTAWEDLEKPDLRSAKYVLAFQAADPATYDWVESMDNIHGPAVAAAKACKEIAGWRTIARKYHAMKRFFPPMPAYLVAAVAVVWLAFEVRESDEALQFIQDGAVAAVSLEDLRYSAPNAFDNYTHAMRAVAYADDSSIETASRAWLVAFNALRTVAPREFATYENDAMNAVKSADVAGYRPYEYFPE